MVLAGWSRSTCLRITGKKLLEYPHTRRNVIDIERTTKGISQHVTTRTPRRTLESFTEASAQIDSVRLFAASDHHSRRGPDVESAVEVLQLAFPGKYLELVELSLPDSHSVSSECPPANANQRRSASSFSSPGRTVESILEAPGPSSSVVPIPACVHRSRPGPESRCAPEVFQLAIQGKYKHDFYHSLPDAGSICSSPDIVVNASSTPDGCSFGRINPRTSQRPTSDSRFAAMVPPRSPPAPSSPGRTSQSSTEALNPPSSVVPSVASNRVPAECSRHPSRPGPESRIGERGFQTAILGKYSRSRIASRPDVLSIPRITDTSFQLLLYYQNVGEINSSLTEYQMACNDAC